MWRKLNTLSLYWRSLWQKFLLDKESSGLLNFLCQLLSLVSIKVLCDEKSFGLLPISYGERVLYLLRSVLIEKIKSYLASTLFGGAWNCEDAVTFRGSLVWEESSKSSRGKQHSSSSSILGRTSLSLLVEIKRSNIERTTAIHLSVSSEFWKLIDERSLLDY